MPSVTLIGVDCATDPRNVGIARALWDGGGCRLEVVGVAATWQAITERVASWCTSQTLIAIDAPLGWPAPLGQALVGHEAGAGIDAAPNALFRRATDDLVAATALLEELRELLPNTFD